MTKVKEKEDVCNQGKHDLGIVRRNAEKGVESYWEYRLHCKKCNKQFGSWEADPNLCAMPQQKKINTP